MNGFEKYLGREDHLQKQVLSYLQFQYPTVPVHHSPLEGKRTRFEQFKIKWLGVRAGFPDLFIAAPHGQRHGLFIELKVKPNKTTEGQRAWLEELSRQGYYASVCYSFDEAKSVIDNYMNNKIAV